MTLLESGVALFNEQEFFRSHEVLEEAWTAENGARRLFLQSLIHIAVACHHWQRRNLAGAAAQLHKALRKLEAYLPAFEGIDTARLDRDAQAALELIETASGTRDYPRIYWTS